MNGGNRRHERGFDPRDLEAWWSRIEIGDRSSSGPLEIFPLIAPTKGARCYRLLPESLAADEMEVLEKQQPEVQELMARNKGKVSVLVLEGDLVMGGKQSRVVVRSVLIPPGSEVPLSVGCVEHGRWDRFSSPSGSADMPADLMLRKMLVKVGNASMSSRGKPRADQRAIWEAVAAKLSAFGHCSPTSDYLDSVKEYDQRPKPGPVAPVPGQIGALALWRGRLIGVEMMGHPDVWRAGADGRLHSYGFTAELAELDPASAPAGPSRSVGEWLDVIRALRGVGRPSVGEGEDLSLQGEGIVGAGLWHARHPVHLAIFED